VREIAVLISGFGFELLEKMDGIIGEFVMQFYF
jgi:hypothetical protein